MRRLWTAWFHNHKECTPVGNLRQPSRQQVITWVSDAWRQIPEDLIAQAFLTCSISNALDGSEGGQCREEIPRPDGLDELPATAGAMVFDDNNGNSDIDFDGFDDEDE